MAPDLLARWLSVADGETSTDTQRVPSLAQLGLPDVVAELTDAPAGILLVGGPPGSGRRTTLVSMLDHVNRRRPVRLVAVEQPIGVVHRDVEASVRQLAVAVDAASFAAGVRAAIAAEADVVVVSDVPDVDTVEAVLEAIDSGLLVLAGMDGDGAADLLDQFVGWLAPPLREAARGLLADALVGTVSQRLAARAGATGRVPVVEVVCATPEVRHALRHGELSEIGELAHIGFSDSIADLFARGGVDLRGALAATEDWPGLHAAMRARGLLAGTEADGAQLADIAAPSCSRLWAPRVTRRAIGR